MARSVDVLVVGGRVAGALTACLFAQQDRRVMVVDRARFPSSTLSTHFFRGAGLLDVVQEAGLLSAVLELGAPPLTCDYSYMDGQAEIKVEPPQDPGELGYCMSIRRESLDVVLLRGAEDAGAEVITGSRVESLTMGDDHVAGVVVSGLGEIEAGLVVGADGRRSMVAERAGAEVVYRSPGRRALYYRYLLGFPGPGGGDPDGAEFSLRGDELAYVFPSDAGRTCVAISVNLTEFGQLRHDAARRFDTLLERHEGLWPRYRDAHSDSRLFGSGPQPDYVRKAAGEGWALVGDAGIHQDPWSGQGMDFAARSASLLVASYSSSDGHWQQTYQQRRDGQLMNAFFETVTGAVDLSSTDQAG